MLKLPLYEAVSEEFNWTERANFRTHLELAGLDDLDDSLNLDGIRPGLFLMHDAARKYARGVVSLSYDDDVAVAVANDDSLQAFALDLCAPRVQGTSRASVGEAAPLTVEGRATPTSHRFLRAGS